jgi:hypothetical protein
LSEDTPRSVQEFRAWARDELARLKGAARNPYQEQTMRAVLHRLRDVPDTVSLLNEPGKCGREGCGHALRVHYLARTDERGVCLAGSCECQGYLPVPLLEAGHTHHPAHAWHTAWKVHDHERLHRHRGFRTEFWPTREKEEEVPLVRTRTTTKVETSYSYSTEELAACLGYRAEEGQELEVTYDGETLVLTLTSEDVDGSLT